MKRAVIALALALAATPALAVKPSPKQDLAPLAWYDSTGKLVGRFIALTALVPVGTDVIPVPMKSVYGAYPYGTFLMGIDGAALFYASTDCSGPAYIPGVGVPGATRPATILRSSSGSTIAYLGSATATPSELQYRSSWENSGRCVEAAPDSVLASVIEVTQQVDLSGLWTPPFTAK